MWHSLFFLNLKLKFLNLLNKEEIIINFFYKKEYNKFKNVNLKFEKILNEKKSFKILASIML